MPGKNVIEIIINAKDDASAVIKTVGTGVLDLGNIGLKALAGGAVAAVAGLGALTAGLGACAKAAMESQQVEAQLDAVLKSTGESIARQSAQWADAQGKFVTTAGLSAAAVADLKDKIAISTAGIARHKEAMIGVAAVYGEASPEYAKASVQLRQMEGAQAKLTAQLAAGQPRTVSMANALGLVAPVAQISKQAVLDLANSLSSVTMLEDDTILAGENMLLTFTNIGKDVFPLATETMLDMSQALGQDLKASAIQLGKALNDPIAGVSALSRVGVNFSDAQKKVIEDLVKSGDIMGAQNLILKELQTEFGGSAEAAGKTFAGKLTILQNRFGNLQETIGGAVIPILSEFIDGVIMPAVPVIEEFANAFSALISGDLVKARDILAKFLPEWVVNSVISFTTAIRALVNTFKSLSLGEINDAFSNLWYFVNDLAQAFGMNANAAGALADVLTGALSGIVTFITGNMDTFKAVLEGVAVAMGGSAMIAAIAGIVTLLISLVNPVNLIIVAAALLGVAWTNNWGGIRDVLTNVWTNTLQPAFAQLAAWLSVNLPLAIQALSGFWTNELQPALMVVWGIITNSIIPILSELYNWLMTLIPPALQIMADYWTTILQPALAAVWEFLTAYVLPLLADLFNWLSVNLPIALQMLSDFWTGVLLPALTAAWEFLNTSLLPMLGALAEVVGATLGLAVTALAGLWQNVLLPALTAAWEFINANIMPLFASLANDTLPKVGNAFEGIKNAISGVTQFLSGLAKDISSLKLPEWLQPGSPTPFEMGLVGIGTALQALASSELPGFDKALGGVANALVNLATTIKSMLDSILAYWKAHNLAVILDITTTWQNIQITISSAFEAIINLMIISLQFMAELWATTFVDMQAVAAEVFAGIATTVQDALNNLVNVIIIPTITSLRSWWDTAWGGFKGAVEGLTTTVSVSFLNALVALETYLRTSFGPAFKYVLDTYIAPFNTFLDGLSRAIITLIGYVDELIQKLKKVKLPELSSTSATETGGTAGGGTSSIFAAPSLSTVPATAAGAISPYSAVTATEAAGGVRLAAGGGNTWNVVVNHTKQTERSLADDINFLSFAYGGANAS